MLTTSSSSVDPAVLRRKKREGERKSRERRASNLDQMRRTTSALERAVLVAQTFRDHDALWEDFLEANVMRVRVYLRECVRLEREIDNLQLQRIELQRLLKEYQLATQSIDAMMQELAVDDWSWKVKHLCELTRKFYRPWTLAECQVKLATALKEVNAFQWSTNKMSTGVSFFGWRDMRRVDHPRGMLQFEFYKTFKGLDMMDSVNVAWDTYTTETMFQGVRGGQRCSLEILQQLGPNIMIVRVVQRHPQVAVDIHNVYLVGRARTGSGITQIVRSLVCPELMTAIEGPGDLWPSNFTWSQWDHIEGDPGGYKFHLGGSFVGADVDFLNKWMVDVFGCVLRFERLATARQVITAACDISQNQT